MTLNFTETSPGVHMAQLEDSSKGTFRTIVIIESLGKFTLYIDGEVALRDLPTFEAAAAQADAILTSKGSRRMVQAAVALVLLSVIGGSAVGAANMLSGSSVLALASSVQSAIAGAPRTESAVASAAQGQQSTTSIVRSRSPVSTVVINAPKSETAESVTPVSEPRTASPVRNVPLTPAPSAQDEPQSAQISPAPAPSTTAQSPTDTAGKQAQGTDNAKAVEPAIPDRRIFSATRPVFGGRPPAAEGSATVVTTAPAVVEQPAQSQETADAQKVEEAPNPYATTTAAPKPAEANEPASEPAQVAETEPQTGEAEGLQVTAVPLPDKNPLGGNAEVAARTNSAQTSTTVAIVPQRDTAPAAQEPSAVAQSDEPAVGQQPIYPITAAPHRAEKNRAFGQRKKARHTRKARKHRKARRHGRRHARRGRVMRCMYGGCRWVKAGGYYDRQYRRHRHLYGRLTKY